MTTVVPPRIEPLVLLKAGDRGNIDDLGDEHVGAAVGVGAHQLRGPRLKGHEGAARG